MSSSDMGRDAHSLTAYSLPTTMSPTLQGALKDSFGETVVACDMAKPCQFPCLDSCQKSFMWTHKKVHLAPHPLIGLVLHVRGADVCLGTWSQKPGSFTQ